MSLMKKAMKKKKEEHPLHRTWAKIKVDEIGDFLVSMASLMVSLRLFKCFFKLQAIFVHRYRRTCIFFQSKTPPITRHTNQDRRQWSLKKERVDISPLFPFHFIPRHLNNRTKRGTPYAASFPA
ncbi:hypothetical protein WN943_015778 [Citrus x changshan-huyou]